MRDVAFLFKRGRRERLAATEDAPTEFFYGYVQLVESGAPVNILDEDELGLASPVPFFWRVLSTLSYMLIGVHLWVVCCLFRRPVRDRLNQYNVLVATTNLQGLSLAVLKRLGKLDSQVIFIAMGVGDLMLRPSRRMVINWLLGVLRTVVISEGEATFLNARLGPRAQVTYVPFGTDERFWTPGEQSDGASRPYVLSIGNDPRRDYARLLAAWKPEYPLLKIVTSQELASTPNVEVISGDWRQQILSDSEVRRLFRDALFVVLPIAPTIQPSGQSACLQAMACGKAVIISDVEGLWDRARMRDGETCVLVPPNKTSPMSKAIETLLAHPDLREHIGRDARKVVESHLNVRNMANHLSQVIDLARAG